MKCDVCGKSESTVHLTEVVNDKISKFHLCEECAKKKSEEMQSHFGLTDLLSGLVDFEPAMPEGELEGGVDLRCSICGMTYQDFQKTGKLGCGKCYDVFSRNLSGLFNKIHGSDRHVGKMPFRGATSQQDQEDLQRLQNELKTLVQAEEFEKAALLRDRLKELETKRNNTD